MGRLTAMKPRLQYEAQASRITRHSVERIRGSSLQVIRERILSRDCGICRCARCERDGMTRLASIVDHRIPLWAGGREADDNRQAINAECHDMKSEHEARCRARGVFVAWTVGESDL